MIDGAYAIAPAFVIIPLIGIGAVHLVLGNTRCAFDGPRVARRRGRTGRDRSTCAPSTRSASRRRARCGCPCCGCSVSARPATGPTCTRRARSTSEQLAAIAAIEGVRFVPLYAARGFLSPGFERLLARYVDRANVIVGPIAAERLGPGWKDRRP